MMQHNHLGVAVPGCRLRQGFGIRFPAVLAAAWLVGWLPALSAAADPPAAAESLPAGAQLAELAVVPQAIELTHAFDYRQLLVTGKLASGDTLDATRMVHRELPENLVQISPTGLVTPLADGSGTIKLSLAGQSVSVSVTVRGQKETYHPSFVGDIMPTLSRLGCNAGTCHGAADGKNGFKLSLRGYDPLLDHSSLIDDLAGRRFNRASPDYSLMLLKPSGAAPHVGGVLTRPGDRYYSLIRQWIADGSPLDLDRPRVKSIEIFPKNPQLPLPGAKQQMVVLASYADGRVRDVTAEAFIETSLAEVVETSKTGGLATAVRRGEAAILARYEGAYAATRLVVMGDRTGFAWQDVPEHNYIDTHVYHKLRKVKILPSALCSDADFIRRVYLDLTGQPPAPEAVKAFLNDPRETRIKRDELIDRLVGSPEYVEHWTNKWADLLQVNRKFLGESGAWALRNWIRQAIAANMPYDQFSYQVLTASGSNRENPPAAYFKVLREPHAMMENTTQLFLGIRFNCNKCHDHPFERWTQDQYYHLAAYFAQTALKEAPEYAGQRIGGTAVDSPKALVEIVYDAPAGEVTHARTGVISPPKFPFEHPGFTQGEGSRREQLAAWITSKENPYFAKSYVNRLWSYLFGPGIIEPVDDIRAGNPPTNPELLDALTKDFIDQGFNVQHILRTICKSRTYQHALATNTWNEDDQLNYSHAYERRLPAETLFDAIYRATGSTPRLPEVPVGFRAAQLPDSENSLPDGFFNLFGKPPRESSCECERSSGMMLGPVLNLVNGPTVAKAIADPNNRIARLVAQTPDDRQLVEELFIAVLCRRPTEQEIAVGLEALRGFEAEQQALAAAVAEYEATRLPERFAAWLKSVGAPTGWTILELGELKSAAGATLTRRDDGSVLVSGNNPPADTYTLQARCNVAGVTAFRLEVLPDDSLAAKGPGRAGNGNFVLNQFIVTAAGGDGAPQPVQLRGGSATFSQNSFSPAQCLGELNPQRGWAVHPQFGQAHTVVFETAQDLPADSVLTFTLVQNFGGQHTIGRFRISATSSARPVKAGGPMLPQNVADILAVAEGQRTPQQQAELLHYYKTIDADFALLQKQSQELAAQAPQGRLRGAQDLVWALINSPAFLFNR